MAWDIGFDQASSSSSSTSSSNSSSSSSISSSSSSSSLSSSSSSTSSSSLSTTEGTVVWGHHTSVDEDFDENFTSNWTTTEWSISGSPGSDDEIIYASNGCGQLSTSPYWRLGAMEAIIKVDKYQTGIGPAPVIQYRTSVTLAGLIVASWSTYNGVSFTSLGWIQIRIYHT
jgi:hypothetical protein